MPTQPLLSDARVVLFTADACITADLPTGGDRVKDVLNLPNTLLELTQLTYSNPDRPGTPLVTYPAGTLRKSEVHCLIVLTEPPQTSVRKFGAYVAKKPIRLSVMIPGMVVVGMLHVQGRYDPAILMTEAAQETFVPLTNAGLIRSNSTTAMGAPPERLTLFVNKAHISGVLLAEEIEETQPTPEPIPLRREEPHRATGTLMGTPMPIESRLTGKTGRLSRFSTNDSEW